MNMIVACAQNRVIGRNGRLPWRLPTDTAYFRRCVADAYLVMGKDTYLTTPSMPGTYPLLLSSTYAAPLPVGEILRDPQEVFRYDHQSRPLWVIGGSGVYTYFLPYIHQLYMTEIHASFDGDRYFPEWQRADFIECSRQCCHDADADLSFDFVVYEQRHPRLPSC